MANRFSVNTGNWNNTATWSATSGGIQGASVPGVNDTAIIENSKIVTVTVDQGVGTISILTAGGIVVNSGKRLTVTNTTTVNGAGTIVSGAGGGGIFNFGLSMDLISGTVGGGAAELLVDSTDGGHTFGA